MNAVTPPTSVGAAFDHLLRWLAPAPVEAEAAFISLRLRLIRFFESQACPLAEDCADDTLQRVAHKIAAGVEVQVSDPYLYARGFARLILQEQWRKHARHAPLEELPLTSAPTIHPDETAQREAERQTRERRLHCLERCLAAQPDESRQLFLAYHREQPGTKIDGRAELAARLGIDVTALRNRITRLRRKLEECVRECVRRDEGVQEG